MAPSRQLTVGILALAATLALAGCAARAKTPVAATAPPKSPLPAAPATPPPLSTPQTTIELPKPQPVDPAALETEAPPPPLPEPPAPSRPSPPRSRTAPRTEPVAPPAATPVPEPPRQQFQEIISPTELKRFQDSAQARKRDVARILDSLKSRHLSKAQATIVTNIRSFVDLSNEAENRNEMRMADMLAEKAQILARNLDNAR
ncbi:MAG TPA: hypothetical protein VMJ75_13055 [Candidatus Acidoferrales bacterium]|nr:hypothetical protein [Candidatus Acidoferrales bacterium]